MRYYPAAIALSLLAAVTASVGQASNREVDPRSAALAAEGRSLLEAGHVQAAIDLFEAALTVDPGNGDLFLDLAEAARQQGLQGKAIRFYREALERDPGNLAAISGEGAALVEKGAIEKARLNLAKLQSMCGSNCNETQQLATVIAKGPQAKLLTAEAITPEPIVTQN